MSAPIKIASKTVEGTEEKLNKTPLSLGNLKFILAAIVAIVVLSVTAYASMESISDKAIVHHENRVIEKSHANIPKEYVRKGELQKQISGVSGKMDRLLDAFVNNEKDHRRLQAQSTKIQRRLDQILAPRNRHQ